MSSKYTGKITALPAPQSSSGMILTYETSTSRKVIHLPPKTISSTESAPHGAGSYHDPEHHMKLMERVHALLLNSNAKK
ncbi:MAG TPA: hypothetical protein DCX06_07135 [Opitutae bacterium]|nr:hypothetical protein [Opitutae bacterium]